MDFTTDFTSRKIIHDGVGIHCRMAGMGPPLLLLHGYPQTSYMWHKIAPALASQFNVVIPDLRGYGDSDKPQTDTNHSPYSKRAMAADMMAVMTALGHDHFAVAGHDRGGRVAHRLARDYPDAVTHLAVLDIVPTEAMYGTTDKAFATAYYHWFFLIHTHTLSLSLSRSLALSLSHAHTHTHSTSTTLGLLTAVRVLSTLSSPVFVSTSTV